MAVINQSRGYRSPWQQVSSCFRILITLSTKYQYNLISDSSWTPYVSYLRFIPCHSLKNLVCFSFELNQVFRSWIASSYGWESADFWLNRDRAQPFNMIRFTLLLFSCVRLHMLYYVSNVSTISSRYSLYLPENLVWPMKAFIIPFMPSALSS